MGQAVNLDRGLTQAQKAEALAFATLIDAHLQPALLYTTWCEAEAYSRFTRPEYGAQQAFPLSYLIPRSQRQAVRRQLQHASTSQASSRKWGGTGAGSSGELLPGGGDSAGYPRALSVCTGSPLPLPWRLPCLPGCWHHAMHSCPVRPPPTHPHTQPADCLPAPAAATQIYAAAAAALDALASRLAASNPKGPYFFGAQPSSIDAPLFAVLSFLKAAPTVHPDLR